MQAWLAETKDEAGASSGLGDELTNRQRLEQCGGGGKERNHSFCFFFFFCNALSVLSPKLDIKLQFNQYINIEDETLIHIFFKKWTKGGSQRSRNLFKVIQASK